MGKCPLETFMCCQVQMIIFLAWALIYNLKCCVIITGANLAGLSGPIFWQLFPLSFIALLLWRPLRGALVLNFPFLPAKNLRIQKFWIKGCMDHSRCDGWIHERGISEYFSFSVGHYNCKEQHGVWGHDTEVIFCVINKVFSRQNEEIDNYTIMLFWEGLIGD